jgi:hypothetical protein
MVKIWCSYGGEDCTYAGLEHDEELLKVDFASGAPLSVQWPKDLFIRLESAQPPDDYFCIGTMFVVSERIKRVFDDTGVHAEYFQIPVVFPRGRKVKKIYYYANVLAIADCLDWKRSKYTLSPRGNAEFIKKICLVETKVPKDPLFYVAKTIARVLCAHDSLVAALNDAECVGPTFATPEDWIGPGSIYDD